MSASPRKGDFSLIVILRHRDHEFCSFDLPALPTPPGLLGKPPC